MEQDFFERVFQVACLVPSGRVTSYGAIARYLGASRSSRMVGWAMSQSHAHIDFVPAHRVVNRNGVLTGKHHFSSENLMQELLEAEGITVTDDKISDFNEIFWDPSIELE